ncbi:YeiH family protein [Streptomyces sp. NPDC004250]|uniref:YeiH family protein n=1 Tax=Streptomyces sp. NPDC004250 TaxID=3364692 RepID=UPI003679E4F7
MSDDRGSSDPDRPGTTAERTTGALTEPASVGSWLRRLVDRLPGLAVAVAVAATATALGVWFPLVGGPVAGIVIGVALAAARRPSERLRPGITAASKFVLQLSVVLLGCQLSLTQVVRVGGSSLPVMLGSLMACLAAAYLVGRRLGIGRDLRTLIGVGTSICGASAIAAVTPVIGAASAEVAYAVSTIFLFNIAAVLVFPALGHLLDMSQQAFGLFAGTAVNDTSSVVAAAATYGDEAGQYAVVVKLTRTLLIIPISLWLAALTKRSAPAASAAGPDTRPRLNVLKLVPWFLVGFLLAVLVNTIGLIPSWAHQGLTTLCVFMITVALSAIGLTTDLRALRRAGPRPLLLGACLWAVVSVTCLLLQYGTSSL